MKQSWIPCKEYPFVDQNFFDLIQVISKDCKKDDWDKVCLVTGAEGVSKSTLTYHGSRIFEGSKKKYNWRKHFMLSPNHEQVIKSVKRMVKSSTVIDEAIKVLYKLKMWDDLQLLINQLYTVNRQNNNLTFINIPRQSDLAKYFRDGRAHYWIQVVARGVANVFVKDDSQFSDDVWCIKENLKQERKLGKGRLFTFLDTEHKIWIHQKLRNFVATIRYADIPEPDRTEYKNEKRAQEFEGLDMLGRTQTNKYKKQRDSLIMELLNTGDFTQVQIANILNITQSSISKIVKKIKSEI